MSNPDDFDPAEAIRQERAVDEGRKQREQAEKQHVQTQDDLRRASILKLLRYREQQLENIRNPVVSEFVVTEEVWWVSEPGWVSKVGRDQRQIRSKVAHRS